MAIIAIDFDGTVVTHEYPRIGKSIGAEEVLSGLIDNGHQLILNTMRSGRELNDAIQWFNDRGIELYGINQDPNQRSWTSSPKVYANLYIDDAALGTPLTMWDGEYRPHVDWEVVRKMLLRMGLLQDEYKENYPEHE